MVAIGIDFGTSQLRVATFLRGKAALVAERDGERVFPAVVGFRARAASVGQRAAERAAMAPESTIRGVKWLLGRAPDDPLLHRALDGLAARVTADATGRGLLVRVGESAHSPRALAVHVFDHLRDLLERQVGGRHSPPVLTVPPWLPASATPALRDAAAEAGLALGHLVPDGVAHALTIPAPHAGKRVVAILDVGAGGVSASIVRIRPQQIVVLASAGDGEAGGNAVDEGLAAFVRAELGPHLPGRLDAGRAAMLLQVVESMKRELSDTERARATLSFLAEAPTIELDREHVARALPGLLRRILGVWRRALDDAGLSPGKLDALYVTGGMSVVPAVRAFLQHTFELPLTPLDVDGGCALGAARLGAMLAGELPAVAITSESAPVRPPRATTAARPPARDSHAAPNPASEPGRRPDAALVQDLDGVRPPTAPAAQAPMAPPGPAASAQLVSATHPSKVPIVPAPRGPGIPRVLGRMAGRPFSGPTLQGLTAAKGLGAPTLPEMSVAKARSTAAAPGVNAPIPGAVAGPATQPRSAPRPPAAPAAPTLLGLPVAQAPSAPVAPTLLGLPVAQVPSAPVAPTLLGLPVAPALPALSGAVERPLPTAALPSPVGPVEAGAFALPLAIGSGRFMCPSDLAGLLALPITGALEASDLAPVGLPVLFARVLERPHVRGVLRLEHPRGRALTVSIHEGHAYLTTQERSAAAQAFLWRQGTFSFEPGEIVAGGRTVVGLARLTMEGLRVFCRSFTGPELEGVLGPRLDLAPVPRESAVRLVSNLGLTGAEHRLIETAQGGLATARALGRSGVGRHAAAELFLLLTVFGALDWRAATLAEHVQAAARKMVEGNHFEALGAHWSASTVDLEEAHRALHSKLDPGGAWGRAAPEACATMRQRADEAYAALRDQEQRLKHRSDEYSVGVDVDAHLLGRRSQAFAKSEPPVDRSEPTAEDELGTSEPSSHAQDRPAGRPPPVSADDPTPRSKAGAGWL